MSTASTVVLPAQLRHSDAAAVLELFRAAIDRGGAGHIDVDASAINQFDSAALAVLLDARREALARGCQLHLVAWPQALQRLATVYGVSELLAPEAAS